MEPENATPQVFAKTSKREESNNDYNDEVEDSFDSREIFGTLVCDCLLSLLKS
jgi:hypothetical protein